jgi:2-amino-4-hydroxy-6-hydroxymethyldihydropteridine diphosphokinase
MQTEPLHEVFLSLGSNLGDKEKELDEAINKIEELIGHVERRSAFYDTAPCGFDSENRFLNCVVMVTTTATPHQVLALTQQIERLLGRTTKSVNGEYHDRQMDIDILLYDDITVDTPELKIPHPRMYERDFVMIPLNEILSE